MSEIVSLFVHVPVASFRVSMAREYFESYPCPPPSTVYGMLLSLVGESNRHRHEGAEIAVALLSKPEWSTVLRTVWRIKDGKLPPGTGNNRRPDYQELLTDLRLAVWVKGGMMEGSTESLASRVRSALSSPAGIMRYGGLSLGESTHLVDELRPLRPSDVAAGHFLLADDSGSLALPVWPDHVGSASRWGQYRFGSMTLGNELPDNAWTVIRRPDLT